MARLERPGGALSLGETAERNYLLAMAARQGHHCRPEAPKILLLIFVIVFAVIVGPINFSVRQ